MSHPIDFKQIKGYIQYKQHNEKTTQNSNWESSVATLLQFGKLFFFFLMMLDGRPNLPSPVLGRCPIPFFNLPWSPGTFPQPFPTRLSEWGSCCKRTIVMARYLLSVLLIVPSTFGLFHRSRPNRRRRHLPRLNRAIVSSPLSSYFEF